jgi:hypothetical protein
MSNTNIIWVVVALAALVIVAAIGLLLVERNKSNRVTVLKQRFGNEYDRAREQFGRGADAILHERLRHVEGLHIRPLTEQERTRFGSAWQTIQAQFIDDPRAAAVRAHVLVGEVMRVRGYPPGDGFEMRCRDLSVDHADVVEHYRAAEITARAQHMPSTEELRQAVVHYRVIIADLMRDDDTTRERHDTPVMMRPRTV